MITTEFSPGEKRPTEKQLAERLGISGDTLRKALLLLWMGGLATRRWGVGTLVPDGGELAAQSHTTVGPLDQMFGGNGRKIAQSATIEQIACPAEDAAALSIEAGIASRFDARTFVVDGQPAFHLENRSRLRIRKRGVDPRAAWFSWRDCGDRSDLSTCLGRGRSPTAPIFAPKGPWNGAWPLHIPGLAVRVELPRWVPAGVSIEVPRRGRPLRPKALRPMAVLPKIRSGKIVRRVIRSVYLGGGPGDLFAPDDPQPLALTKEAR